MFDDFEEFSAHIQKQFGAVVAAGSRLPDHVNPLFNRPVSEPLHKVLRFMAKVVANDFSALLVLALKGYGVAGAKIARSMFEASVNAAFLKRNPHLLEDYLDFHYVTKRQFFKHLVKYAPRQAAEIPREIVEQMEKDYEAVQLRFPNKSSWAATPLAERAEQVGAGPLYRVFYPNASGITHVDIRALIAHADPGGHGYDVEFAPSENWIRESLALGHNAVVSITRDYNEAARLDMDAQIAEIHSDWKTAWAQNVYLSPE